MRRLCQWQCTRERREHHRLCYAQRRGGMLPLGVLGERGGRGGEGRCEGGRDEWSGGRREMSGVGREEEMSGVGREERDGWSRKMSGVGREEEKGGRNDWSRNRGVGGEWSGEGEMRKERTKSVVERICYIMVFSHCNCTSALYPSSNSSNADASQAESSYLSRWVLLCVPPPHGQRRCKSQHLQSGLSESVPVYFAE